MSNEQGSWYVVADGRQARVLTRDGHGLRTVRRFDQSGKGDAVENSESGTSQLKAPKADPERQAETHFAEALTEFLNEAVRTGKASSLTIAASARTLHEIREGLSKEAEGKVAKTMSKDLTNTPDAELASHFD